MSFGKFQFVSIASLNGDVHTSIILASTWWLQVSDKKKIGRKLYFNLKHNFGQSDTRPKQTGQYASFHQGYFEKYTVQGA